MRFFVPVLALGLFNVLNQLALAEGVTLGNPIARGNGCKDQSISAALSPDNEQLSILFDGFSANVEDEQKMDRKSCDIIIPVKLPRGKTISILQMDYRGYNFLPKGASANVIVDYYLGNWHGRPSKHQFEGELDENFYFSETLNVKERSWAPCGREVQLHMNSDIVLRTNREGAEAMSTLDSIDVSSGVVYQVEIQDCEPGKEGKYGFRKIGHTFWPKVFPKPKPKPHPRPRPPHDPRRPGNGWPRPGGGR